MPMGHGYKAGFQDTWPGGAGRGERVLGKRPYLIGYGRKGDGLILDGQPLFGLHSLM